MRKGSVKTGSFGTGLFSIRLGGRCDDYLLIWTEEELQTPLLQDRVDTRERTLCLINQSY